MLFYPKGFYLHGTAFHDNFAHNDLQHILMPDGRIKNTYCLPESAERDSKFNHKVYALRYNFQHRKTDS